MPSADPARRSQLLGLKLTALVRDHLGSDAPVSPGVWPGGAALVRDGVAWVLAEDEPHRALGRALAWALQQGATNLNLLAEESTGLLARRASYFSEPPTVWRVNGRSIVAAGAEPHADVPVLDDELAAFGALIESAGAVPLVERGVLLGEVEGLEVCRAVRDPFTGVCRLEVGVGAHDREAFQLVHGDVPTPDALRMVIDAVRPHRRPGAEPHPLNRLGAERAVRARFVREPGLVGARRLAPADPPVERQNVKDTVPCVAAGETVSGEPLVVVCSTGVDLDVVPWAADARSALAPDNARLVLALPARDAVAVTRSLASLLRHPAVVLLRQDDGVWQ